MSANLNWLPFVKEWCALGSNPSALTTLAFQVAISTAYLVAGGIEFIDENGGGAGVRLKKPHKKRT